MSLNPVLHPLPSHFTKLKFTNCHSCPTHTHTHKCRHRHRQIHACTHVHTDTYTRVLTHIHRCMQIHICMYMHTHTHTCANKQKLLAQKEKQELRKEGRSPKGPPQCLPHHYQALPLIFKLLIFTSSVTTSKQFYCRCPGPRVSSCSDSKFLFPLGPHHRWHFTSQ